MTPMNNLHESRFARTENEPGAAIKPLVPDISDLFCMNLRFLITEIIQLRVIIAFSNNRRLSRLLDYENDCIFLANYPWIKKFGLQATFGLIAAHPQLKLLVYLTPNEVRKSIPIFNLGSKGFFTDAVTRVEFQQGLARLGRGETFYSQDFIRRLLTPELDPEPEVQKPVKISKLERRIFAMILKGLTDRQIATRLSMTLPAVTMARGRLNYKFGDRDCEDLIRPGGKEPKFVPYELDFPGDSGNGEQKYTVYLR